MNKIALFISIFIFGLIIRTSVFSATSSFQNTESNRNKVVYYPDGIHAIPTDPVAYLTGTSLVTRRENTGQIQSWSTGEDGSGFHSVWNITKDNKCPERWVYFVDPFPEWGDYFTPDANYCVFVNTY